MNKILVLGFLGIVLLTSCDRKEKVKEILTADHYWLMDDVVLHDSLDLSRAFMDNIFKFYSNDYCQVPLLIKEYNVGNDLVSYTIFESGNTLKMHFDSKSPFLTDTFNVELETENFNGVSEYVLTLESDSLYYRIIREGDISF